MCVCVVLTGACVDFRRTRIFCGLCQSRWGSAAPITYLESLSRCGYRFILFTSHHSCMIGCLEPVSPTRARALEAAIPAVTSLLRHWARPSPLHVAGAQEVSMGCMPVPPSWVLLNLSFTEYLSQHKNVRLGITFCCLLRCLL